MKSLLVMLLLVGCGGAEFSSEETDTGASLGGESASAGAGSSSEAGALTDGGVGGTTPTVTAGQPSAGSGGAPMSSCALDKAALAAVLPSNVTWDGFHYAAGETCVSCSGDQCKPLNVVSWGLPQDDNGQLVFLPNTDQPMVPITVGANDGSCTKTAECGAKLGNPTLKISVERTPMGWQVVEASAYVPVAMNACTASSGADPALRPMGEHIADRIEVSVLGLEIPCE